MQEKQSRQEAPGVSAAATSRQEAAGVSAAATNRTRTTMTRRQRSYLNLYMAELKYGTAEAQFLEKLAQKMGGHPQASQMAQWKG